MRKELCGYGCGRVWDEIGRFVDCVSAYHIPPSKKIVICLCGNEMDIFAYRKELINKIENAKVDHSKMKSINEGLDFVIKLIKESK